jgi:hypothetical protein
MIPATKRMPGLAGVVAAEPYGKQGSPERCVIRKASRRIFLERAHYRLGKRARDLGTELADIRRFALEHRCDKRNKRFCVVRRFAGEKEVERSADGIDIRARVDVGAAELFRRGECRRAKDGSTLRKTVLRLHQRGDR